MAVSWSCATARAALDVRIDMSTYSGSPGGNWNTITLANANSTTANLTDYTTGLNSGLSIQGFNWNGEWAGSSFPGWSAIAGVSDRLYDSSGNNGQFLISGLNAGKIYQFEVISSGDSTVVRTAVGGNYADISYNGITTASVLQNWNQTTHGDYQQDWLMWTNVIASAGTALVDIQRISGTYVNVNAIRITEVGVVPEPATALMISAGGVLIALYRRFFGRV